MNFLNYFYEPLKINHTNVWFWSDMHMGHKCDSWETPLWKSRGFSSVEEHDERLVYRWNNLINLDSTVFHLGDIMFGYDGESRIERLLNILNFKELYLMGGNHHAGFKQLFKKSKEENSVSFLELDSDKKAFFIPNYFEIIVCGQPIVLSHYPLASWNGQSKGSFMIHGHCHANLYKSEIGKILYNNCKIIDVGVEAAPFPKKFPELKSLFLRKTNTTFDHHDSKTNNPF